MKKVISSQINSFQGASRQIQVLRDDTDGKVSVQVTETSREGISTTKEYSPQQANAKLDGFEVSKDGSTTIAYGGGNVVSSETSTLSEGGRIAYHQVTSFSDAVSQFSVGQGNQTISSPSGTVTFNNYFPQNATPPQNNSQGGSEYNINVQSHGNGAQVFVGNGATIENHFVQNKGVSSRMEVKIGEGKPVLVESGVSMNINGDSATFEDNVTLERAPELNGAMHIKVGDQEPVLLHPDTEIVVKKDGSVELDTGMVISPDGTWTLGG